VADGRELAGDAFRQREAQRRQRQLAFRPNPDRACGFSVGPSQPVVLVAQFVFRDNRPMDPSPGRWAFETHRYGLANVLLDRDGRVIGCNLPIGNGPLLEQAPAMAQILREFVAGVPAEQLRTRAAQVLDRIDTGRDREPGEDDE
jgi:hypothetical protein